MEESPRDSGVDILGKVRWGSHYCQFYKTKGDLIDLLVPFFKTGLENNEVCTWITAEDLDVEEAREAMQKAVPDFADYLKKGQMVIHPYNGWYLTDGAFDPKKALNGLTEMQQTALNRGYDGLRITGNTCWLKDSVWKDFAAYEREVNETIGNSRIIAICTYPLEKCDANDILDVTGSHQFVLIKREGNWTTVESTDHHRAELALREQEKFRAASLYARSLIEASLDPFVVISLEGKITDVNAATEQVTGHSREELIGSDFSDCFTEPEKARDVYQLVFANGFVKDFPLAIHHKSGKITDVLYNATVYKNAAGDVQGVFADARDVTELMQAEQRIRQQAELLDNAHESITVRDLTNRIIYWNKGSERLYGWRASEVIGKMANELLFKGDPAQPFVALKTVIEKGAWNGEMRHADRSGKEIIVDSHWSLLLNNNGKPESILTINTDITGKKKLESQFLRVQRMESIGTLAGGIAHDLNNILTPILLSVELFKQKLLDEQSQQLVVLLEANVNRAADLVRQVLTFARGVEGEHKPIQLSRLITDIERTLKETFPKLVSIRTNIAPDLWGITGDATQVHQVLMNLCLNARDAMPYGGMLTISANNYSIDENYARMNIEAKTGPHVIISVTDNGTGISPKVMEHLFEPFYTTKRQGEGTGLGLSTSLAIVNSHGGFIQVYTEFGKGTTFKVYLPAITSQETKDAEKVQLELLKGHGELVLFVDDEELIRKMAVTALEEYGFKTLGASDGSEAVALYAQRQREISLVILDMLMPIMDGPATIRALRKIDPKIKIIAISGLNKGNKSIDGSEIANTFISKPYTTQKMLKTIQDVLASKI
nr:MEDS domain-containing protein [Candidatus Sigynarchaeota archaeon]